MNCPNCHRTVADDARFCGYCRQMLRALPSSSAEPVLAVAGGYGAGATAARTVGAGLVSRVKNMLLAPKSEWPVVAGEPTTAAQLYTGYVIPLAVIAALISLVHTSIIGISLPFGGSLRTPIGVGLTYTVVGFAFGLLGLFLVGGIINALAPTFSGTRDLRQALKTAAYSFTPAYVSSVFALLPFLSTLLMLIAGCYGIYLLYLGLPHTMRAPREKAGGYAATVVLSTVLLGVLFAVVTAAFGGVAHRFGSPSSAAALEQSQDQATAAVGNVIGGALGTDDQGKAGIGAALSNLAKAGSQIEAAQTGGTAGSAGASSATASSDSAASSADSAQNAMGATAGLLTALGGALGGSHRVEPVNFSTLKQMLPQSLAGMTRSNAQGSGQQALGVKSTSASADYTGKEGARAQVKISDISGVSGLLDVAGSLVQDTNSESDTGYEKEVSLGGRSVHEKFDRKANHGELSAIIAKRFEVDVSGENMDMSALERGFQSIDLSQLENMKNAGASR